jgi:hypothetical protein
MFPVRTMKAVRVTLVVRSCVMMVVLLTH